MTGGTTVTGCGGQFRLGSTHVYGPMGINLGIPVRACVRAVATRPASLQGRLPSSRRRSPSTCLWRLSYVGGPRHCSALCPVGCPTWQTRRTPRAKASRHAARPRRWANSWALHLCSTSSLTSSCRPTNIPTGARGQQIFHLEVMGGGGGGRGGLDGVHAREGQR